MTKPLLLLAAAGLALSACAPTQPARTVFISAPGVHHVLERGGRTAVRTYRAGPAQPGGPVTVRTYRAGSKGDQIVIIQHPHGAAISAGARADALRHAEAARRHAREATRMARLMRPDPDEIARITREAQAAGEAGRRAGERARRQGEIARLHGEAARRQGEAARRMGEDARRRGEAIRQHAERLREQCERGEIKCEIIITEQPRSLGDILGR